MTANLHPLSQRILAGGAPEPLCLAAARGAVPVPAEELLRLRVHLAANGSEAVAKICRESLAQQPAAELVPMVSDSGCAAEVLVYMADLKSQDEEVMAAVIQNPVTPDEAIAKAAAAAPLPVLEHILDNETRVLRSPELLQALGSNQALTGNARVRFENLSDELARRAKRRQRPAKAKVEPQPGEATTPDADLPELAPAREEAPAEPAADQTADGEPQRPEPEAEEEQPEGDLLTRIMNMSVPDKIQLAMTGNREERAILVRDHLRVVAMAVIKSPKLTEPEVESFAGMRSLIDDVIRAIADNREWTKNYTVVHALCKNPRAPVRKVLTLMTRLTNRDLKLLGSDRGVPEVVRNNARRFYVARTQPKKTIVKK